MDKRGTILVLSVAEFLGMSVWFSASAVVPVLTREWSLSGSDQAWLTMSVQIGFVVGALGSSLFNLADYFAGHRFFGATSLLASLATVLIPLLSPGFAFVLFLRFLTGFFLAGVYPVGMKIIATWTKEDRGLGIGLLVGALTLGSAAPHLINAFDTIDEWRPVLLYSSALAAIGGLLTAQFVREGPYRVPMPKFDWRYVGEILRRRELILANAGYLGHMWELYAMWAWVPLCILSSFRLNDIGPSWASGVSFAVIGVGGIGSLVAGYFADRIGRTTTTIASMAVSGACSVLVGILYGGSPWVFSAVCIVWGFAVVADSAQFSACISELCRSEYVGTALTLQTSIGFLLTLVTIRLSPPLVQWVGWRWAFAFLSIGPVTGIWAMSALRRLPEAMRLAGGRK